MMYTCFVLALLCGQLIAEQAAHECPSRCACAGHLATCTFKYFTQIIQEDAEIHPAYWNLSHVHISHLTRDTFQLGRHFEDPFILDLSYSHISYVSDIAFSHLKNMQQLILNGNNITDIGFKHMRSDNLRTLDLSYNHHLKLPEHGFGLHNLESLKMIECALSHIPKKFFSHMTNIQILHLEKNKLTHLAAGIVSHLPLGFIDLSDNNFEIFPSELIYHLRMHTYMKLDNNPFQCNCNVHHSYKLYMRNVRNEDLRCNFIDDTNSTTSLSFHDFFEDQCGLYINISRSSSNIGQSMTRPQGTGGSLQESSSSLNQLYIILLAGLISIIVIGASIALYFRLKRNLGLHEPYPQRFSILRANDDA